MTPDPLRILLAEMSRTRHEGPARSALHLLAHVDPERIALTPVFSFPLRELAEKDLPPKGKALHVCMPRPTWQATPTALAQFGSQVLKASGELTKIIREQHMVLVHSNSLVNIHAAVAARRTHSPLVVSVREIMAPKRANRMYVQWVCGGAAAVHAVSAAVRDSLVSLGVAERKITIIPNGIDIPQITDRQIADVRREFNISEQAPVVCIVGTITELKGHHVLLDAVREVLAAVPDARVLVVGASQADSGEYEKRLRAAAEHAPLAGRVIFTGRRDDAPALLAACDVHAQPSVLPDSLPRTVLEAMAAGTPTVGSHIGGIPEMVVHGQTGILVPPGDARALSQAIQKLFLDPDLRTRMGAAARQRAGAQFSPSAPAVPCFPNNPSE